MTIPDEIMAAARKAAASAQTNEDVAKMILSGKFDCWPNVIGAANAIAVERQRCAEVAAAFGATHPAGRAVFDAILGVPDHAKGTAA